MSLSGEEGDRIDLFFFAPRYRKTKKVNFSNQLKENCRSFSGTIAGSCQKHRETFIQHLKNKDSTTMVVDSGVEYLKQFYGFVLEPNMSELSQVSNDDEERSEFDDDELAAPPKEDFGDDGEDDEDEDCDGTSSPSDFRISKLRHTIKFEWTTSLSKDDETPFQDSFYEAACVLYNVIIGEMLVINDLLTRRRTKEGFKEMMVVWGMCEFLERNCIFEDPVNSSAKIPFDLNKSALSALKLMTVAQANELGVVFALNKDKKFKLVAMLAKGCAETFLEAYKKIEGNLDSEEVSSKELKCWGYYLKLKYHYYEVFSLLYNAVYQNSLEKNGNAMKLMERCKEEVGHLKKLCNSFVNNYWRRRSKECAKSQVQYLIDQVQRYDINFQKENEMIYHKSMPTDSPDLLEATKIGKPTTWNLPTASAHWREYPKFTSKHIGGGRNDDSSGEGKKKGKKKGGKNKKGKKKKEECNFL